VRRYNDRANFETVGSKLEILRNLQTLNL